MRAVLMLSSIAMGGSERVLVSLLPYIKAQGIDVRLCTLNTRRDSLLVEDFQKSGIPRFDMGAKRMLDPQAWKKFVAMLKDEKIDIIHAQDQDTNIYAAAAHRRHGMPSVMTRHVMVEPTDTRKEAIRAQMVFAAAKYGFDGIVAVSNAVRHHFSKQAGIPLSKIETIYNGIEVDRFATRDKRAAKRQEMGWDEATPIVIMVAVLRRGKGHEVLFEAVPAIKAAVPNVKIMLVGEGELSDSLREQAKLHSDVIEFLGQRGDVSELLGASDVLVLPSLSEALPTVLIEAGAASLPLVATDVGGSAEIVVDGETGYIVPPNQSEPLAQRLIELLQNPAFARQMGENARQRVVKIFSLEEQAKQTVALYERVLASKN